MDSKFTDAMNYLAAPADSFWKWDERGAVVIWLNGSTLAFREELAVVVARLSPKLPSFDAVLLLIAATRAYWSEDSLALQLRLKESERKFSSGSSPFFSELFKRLEVIRELPDELIRSVDAKAELATTVFEMAPAIVNSNVAAVVYEILVQRLIGTNSSLSELQYCRQQSSNSLFHDLRPLKNGLEGITKQALLLRQKTGLDSEPEPASLEISVDQPVNQPAIRSLLLQLVTDEELGGLSRLARNLAAVVQLPRAISDSDELPLGGVSDLTNRGSLDRLLLSELAHDDLMLATRVALNEALYLRREVPPSFPPERRHVLIDSGLRMWGVPRVFSTAVALSMAATGGKDASLSAYRASGTRIIPIDLATREGLISQLGTLEPEVHPGQSLGEFFDRVTQADSPGDIVLITTEAVLDDPDFQRDFRIADGPAIYIATVNRDGDFQLWSHGPRGRKSHASLKLDLDDLLTPASKGSPKLIDTTIDPNSPAITRIQPFPFRLPYLLDRAFKKDAVWSVPLNALQVQMSIGPMGEVTMQPIIVSSASVPSSRLEYGVMVLTRDRRLLLFDDSARGALQLSEGLPFGKCQGSWLSDDGKLAFALIYRESDPSLQLLTVDLVHGQVQCEQLPSKYLSSSGPGSQLLGSTAYGGIVYVIYRKMIEAFDVTTKELLDSTYSELPERWKRGRYFWNPALGYQNAWSVISFDGSSIGFQRVPLKRAARYDEQMIAMFDRRGSDGPFAVNASACLVNLSDHTWQHLFNGVFSDFRVLDFDEGGERLLVRFDESTARKTQKHVIDSQTWLNTNVSNVDSLAQVDASRVNTGTQPMRHFTRVFIADDKLTLVSKGQVCWQFAVKSKRLVMVLFDKREAAHLSQGFEPVKRSTFGYSLSVAKWNDGSRAWIDSRGLLHLQSSNRQIPEATFVLAPTGVAVWTSDGRTMGPAYYVENTSSTISAWQVIVRLLDSFVACLR